MPLNHPSTPTLPPPQTRQEIEIIIVRDGTPRQVWEDILAHEHIDKDSIWGKRFKNIIEYFFFSEIQKLYVGEQFHQLRDYARDYSDTLLKTTGKIADEERYQALQVLNRYYTRVNSNQASKHPFMDFINPDELQNRTVSLENDLPAILQQKRQNAEVVEASKEVLLQAATDGNIPLIEKCLEKKISIDSRETQTNLTPLMKAIMAGNFATAKLLIERGAKLSLTNSENRNAFAIAIMNSQWEIAMWILERQFNQVNSNSIWQRTKSNSHFQEALKSYEDAFDNLSAMALMQATTELRNVTVRDSQRYGFLLQFFMMLFLSVNLDQSKPTSFIRYTARINCLKRLYDKLGFINNSEAALAMTQITPFAEKVLANGSDFSISSDRIAMLKEYVSQNPVLPTRNSPSSSSSASASSSTTSERSSPVHKKYEGLDLRTAAAEGKIEIITACVTQGLNVNEAGLKSGKTAMHQAAEKLQIEALILLAENGGNPYLTDKQSHSVCQALMTALQASTKTAEEKKQIYDNVLAQLTDALREFHPQATTIAAGSTLIIDKDGQVQLCETTTQADEIKSTVQDSFKRKHVAKPK